MKNLNFAAIYHLPYDEYSYTLPTGECVLLLRTEKDNWDTVSVLLFARYIMPGQLASHQSFAMEKIASDEMYDYFQAIFKPQDPRMYYYFKLQSSGITLCYTADGVKTPFEVEHHFENAVFCLNYAYPQDEKPAWARGSIAYQIFPDRFARFGRGEVGMEKWESEEVGPNAFFGGNLKGIISKIPYLKRLGVKIVYLNPIFKADTSHRYDTIDYFTIDERLGTVADLKNLSDELHKNEMYLVLDGVFNHSSTKFTPFDDAKQKRQESPFYDWYFWGDYSPTHCGYACFGTDTNMPKLNLQNLACIEYFCEVGKYWIKNADIDGWRLDVAPEVHPHFWHVFRHEMRATKKDILLIAEHWHDARFYCNRGDMLDATINFPWSRAVWGLFAKQDITLNDFANQITKNYLHYPLHVTQVNWNILGNHDTPRFFTLAKERLDCLEAAVFFQFTMPGVPLIYYGDEVGMQGENDPYCRFPMRWEKVNDTPVLRYYKQLAHLRNKYEALQIGDFKIFSVDEEQGIFAYTRSLGNDTMLCVICAKEIGITKATLKIPTYIAKRIFLRDEVSGERFNCSSSALVLPFKYGKCYCFPISKTLDVMVKENK